MNAATRECPICGNVMVLITTYSAGGIISQRYTCTERMERCTCVIEVEELSQVEQDNIEICDRWCRYE